MTSGTVIVRWTNASPIVVSSNCIALTILYSGSSSTVSGTNCPMMMNSATGRAALNLKRASAYPALKQKTSVAPATSRPTTIEFTSAWGIDDAVKTFT